MLKYFSVLYYVKMKEQNGINNCLWGTPVFKLKSSSINTGLIIRLRVRIHHVHSKAMSFSSSGAIISDYYQLCVIILFITNLLSIQVTE